MLDSDRSGYKNSNGRANDWSGIFSMSGEPLATEADIWSRGAGVGNLPPEVASELLRLRISAGAADWVPKPRSKANRGLLTIAEGRELDNHFNLG